MEEGEAAAVVGIEPPAQVVPALDLVHRLVGDDLVEDGGGRVPVDAAQHQEAAVEPGGQQVAQVAVEGAERGISRGEQVAAQLDDLGGRPRRQVEAAEELDARALHRPLQGAQRGGLGAGDIGLGGARHLGRIGLHGAGQELEEVQPVRRAEAPVAAQQLAGDGDAGRLAAVGAERIGQLGDVVLAAGAAQRARQQLAALLGHRGQQFLQERDVHATCRLPINCHQSYMGMRSGRAKSLAKLAS